MPWAWVLKRPSVDLARIATPAAYAVEAEDVVFATVSAAQSGLTYTAAHTCPRGERTSALSVSG